VGANSGFEVNGDSGSSNARLLAYDRNVSAYRQMDFNALAHTFLTLNTERMRIDSSGNVGIGISSGLVGKFNTVGSNNTTQAVFSGSTGDTARGLRIATGSTGYAGNDIAILDAQYTPRGTLAFQTQSTERMRIDYNGDYLFLGGTLRIKDSGNTAQRGAIYGDAERMRIDGSGNVGIGTSSPSAKLEISGVSNSIASVIKPQGALPDNNDNAGLYVLHQGTAGTGLRVRTDNALTGSNFAHILVNNASASINAFQVSQYGSGYIADFNKSGTSHMRIDTNGNVGIGTSSPSTKLHVSNNAAPEDNLTLLTLQNGNSTGDISTPDTFIDFVFKDSNTNVTPQARIAGHAGSGGDANTQALEGRGYLTFHTSNTSNESGVEDPPERMRITSDGKVGIGTSTSVETTSGSSPRGTFIHGSGGFETANYQSRVGVFNRLNNDGVVISIRQNGTEEGIISVSGSTVSYNGGHLARWSRLLDNSKDTSIVKGTVMTNLDEMVEWGDEDNEQLNKMAVSSVEGDANVAGVFVNWDDDDDWNDMNIAMTGDMVIRIAQGTTVARGDLLMSAGDGTAKPQDDDIVRSKTIAKVTSVNVSHTYDDGTYLVPCVLMAC
jgi:hypothetical protein